MEKYNINNRNSSKISSIQWCCMVIKILFFKVDLISKINFLASEKCYLRLTLLHLNQSKVNLHKSDEIMAEAHKQSVWHKHKKFKIRI